MNKYTIDNTIRLTAAIATVANNAPVDPQAITLTIRLPDGTDLDYSNQIVKDSTGNYHADYLPTQVGLYQYQWQGTGIAFVTSTGQFLVNVGLL